MRTGFPLILTVLGALTLASCGSSSSVDTSTLPFAVALIGDSPYGTGPTDTAQFTANPAFITAINNTPDLSLALHVGDIHSGKEYCTDSYNLKVFNQWKSFNMPLVYIPGDNEWADCHKFKQGGGYYDTTTSSIVYSNLSFANGDPLANLSLVRSIFFPKPSYTLGKEMAIHSQSLEYDVAHPADSQFVENVWFEKNKVLFMTLNIPGGSNNGTDVWYPTKTDPFTSGPITNAQTQEFTNRSAANLRWIDTAFAKATANGDAAVVIQTQADMWDQDGSTQGAAHLSNYKQFIDKIAAKALAFGKPVLMINGDSHNYRSDNPLVPNAACVVETAAVGAVAGTAAPCNTVTTVSATYGATDAYANQPGGYNVPNFHRIVLHTSATTPLEYLKLSVDLTRNAPNGVDAFGPFAWTRVKPN